MKNKFYLVLAIAMLTAFAGFNADGQISSGGTFSITQSVIASGGGTSSNGNFEITGAIGQPVTDSSNTSTYLIRSGFFSAPFMSPTAAAVSIGGRALTFAGNGIPRVFVSITDQNGIIRTTTTNSFGYYSFDNIQAGETYIVSVSTKQIQFSQPIQIIFVSENITSLNFTALP